MDQIKAIVTKINYRNAERDWYVAKLQNKDTKETFTATGPIPNADSEIEIIVYGEWVEDKKYGTQFKVLTSHKSLPTNVQGLARYLAASEDIKGIGPVRASNLVAHFGSRLFDVLNNQQSTELIQRCPGISSELAKRITSSWKQDSSIRQLSIYLAQHGISAHWARKILKQWDAGTAIESIQKNPYELTAIDGIGFHTADEMAFSLGYKKDSPERITAACVYVLQKASSEGHVFLYEHQLIDEVVKLIVPRGKDETKVREQAVQSIITATNNKQIKVEVIDDNYSTIKLLYLPHLYKAEKSLAESIVELNSNDNLQRPIGRILEEVQQNEGIKLTSRQLDAVRGAFSNHTMVITGGPGTGKTTCVRTICKIAEKMHLQLVLTAPTGRAAKRLSEVTGRDATTIHRLLKWRESGPTIGRDNPITTDILIVDESSMLDVELGYKLFEAIPRQSSVVLIGDSNQLPAISAGSVLRDIIASHTISVYTLGSVFRQAEQSLIVRNAHLIRKGELPRFPETKGVDEDCYVMWMPSNPNKNEGKDNVEWMKEKIVRLVTTSIPKEMSRRSSPTSGSVNPIRDIQVLTPMKKGTIGTHELNKVLQNALNPNGIEFAAGGKVFRYGDRVMQTRNNYDEGMEIYNGDIGFIVSNNTEDKCVDVDFDGRYVHYPYNDLADLHLSYVQTIHKSQGSEYPVTIVVLSYQHWCMLERNLLYTASTRAQKLCVFMVAKGAIQQAVKNNPVHSRNSYLAHRLRAHLSKEAVNA